MTECPPDGMPMAQIDSCASHIAENMVSMSGSSSNHASLASVIATPSPSTGGTANDASEKDASSESKGDAENFDGELRRRLRNLPAEAFEPAGKKIVPALQGRSGLSSSGEHQIPSPWGFIDADVELAYQEYATVQANNAVKYCRMGIVPFLLMFFSLVTVWHEDIVLEISQLAPCVMVLIFITCLVIRSKEAQEVWLSHKALTLFLRAASWTFTSNAVLTVARGRHALPLPLALVDAVLGALFCPSFLERALIQTLTLGLEPARDLFVAWKEEGQGEGGGGGGGQDAEGWNRGVTGLWVYVGSLFVIGY